MLIKKPGWDIWNTSSSLEKSIYFVHGDRWGLCSFSCLTLSAHINFNTHTMELIPTTSLRVSNVISRIITLAVVEQNIWTTSYIYSLKMLNGLGFKGYHLCKVEQDENNIADSISLMKLGL